MRRILILVAIALALSAPSFGAEAALSGNNAFAVTATAAVYDFSGSVRSIEITNTGSNTVYGQVYYSTTDAPTAPAASTSSPLLIPPGVTKTVNSSRGLRYVALVCGAALTSTASIVGISQ